MEQKDNFTTAILSIRTGIYSLDDISNWKYKKHMEMLQKIEVLETENANLKSQIRKLKNGQ